MQRRHCRGAFAPEYQASFVHVRDRLISKKIGKAESVVYLNWPQIVFEQVGR